MAEHARILVVDDEPAVQQALTRALTLERYEVEQATDGARALERLGADPYDAVVLDVSMPRVDGLEVCRRMRGGGDRTPVLMLTARGEIVRQVVEQHGGTIAAEAAPGGGTLMRVLLPHAEAVTEEQTPAYAAR